MNGKGYCLVRKESWQAQSPLKAVPLHYPWSRNSPGRKYSDLPKLRVAVDLRKDAVTVDSLAPAAGFGYLSA
jgi:hypothetical protein